MANVLLVILLIISVILIGLILIQRSEGGALGIGGGGGGGGGGGLMSGRGTADMVQKMTAFFGVAFLLVSLLISISFNVQNKDKEEFGTSNAPAELSAPEKIQNNDLNAPVVSDKDTTPLVEDSQSGESDTKPEEKPEEKPQD